MTRVEFAEVIAYIGFGCGRPLEDRRAVEVYFDLLGDLPADVFRLAAKRVLTEHKYATFPTVAELRAAAVDSARGEVQGITPAEGWAMAWWIVGNCDPELPESFDRACKRAKAPPLVVEAIRAVGLADLCFGQEPVGVLRGQFLKMFEQLRDRDRRQAILPPAVRAELAGRKEAVAAPPAGPARAIVDKLAESFQPAGV